MREVAHFTVHFLQYLNEHKQLSEALPPFATPEFLQQAYQAMLRTRVFDQKAVALQRTGQLGTYPSILGQEAISVAIGLALDDQDVYVPYYRDHGAQLLRGHKMQDLLLYWGGDERGSAAGAPHDLPVCVPIATQLSHAAGIAAAKKIRNESGVALVTIGDGGSSKGDFFESLNLAGAWQLPMVVVLNNNQWAISVHRSIQCGAKTLAQKGIAAGIAVRQVDGNDVLAVYDAICEAKAHAAAHKGATLIEAVSYRLSDHTTADDATRYRPKDEVSEAWAREPVARLRDFMMHNGWWSESLEKSWLEHCQQEVEAAVQAYLAVPPDTPESMFDHLYAQWPSNMDEQLSLLEEKIQRNGGVQ